MSELEKLLGAALERRGAMERPQPIMMTPEKALAFLTGAQKFRVGDIVKLRPGMEAGSLLKRDHECIVTQCMDKPVYAAASTDDINNAQAAVPHDIAIAYTVACGEPDCVEEHVIEFLYDSRNFMKIGSIFDKKAAPAAAWPFPTEDAQQA